MFGPFALASRALQILLSLYAEDPLPVVSLGSTTNVNGINNPGSPTQSFLGIPFASAPRFDVPVPVQEYPAEIDATRYGPACIQQNVTATATPVILNVIKMFNLYLPDPKYQSEDCLSVNVIRPARTTKSSRLPVVAFIYGGGFLNGDSKGYDNLGKTIVEKSIEKTEDVIFVSLNYRLSAYGFLAGNAMKEISAGNVGLRDQREALRWIQKYIHYFGGDPDSVTVLGHSAGAISATLQMLAYNGDASGLFHGIFALSGAVLPVGGMENGQPQFLALSDAVGCGDRNDDQEKLKCLQTVPLGTLQAAVDATDSFLSIKSLVLTWHPRADGEFLTDNPYKLLEQDKFARVPIVTGNVDDEGTFFTLCTVETLFNDIETMDWIKTYWAPITLEERQRFNATYPNDFGVSGSPFDTPSYNTWINGNDQYKRIAAFQGDMVFQAPRRFLAESLSNKTNVWVYLSKQWKSFPPVLGSFHGSDLDVKQNHYLMAEYAVRFANRLDPNLEGSAVPWPSYELPDPKVYLFNKKGLAKDFPPPVVAEDNQRKAGFEFLTELAKKYPL